MRRHQGNWLEEAAGVRARSSLLSTIATTRMSVDDSKTSGAIAGVFHRRMSFVFAVMLLSVPPKLRLSAEDRDRAIVENFGVNNQAGV